MTAQSKAKPVIYRVLSRSSKYFNHSGVFVRTGCKTTHSGYYGATIDAIVLKMKDGKCVSFASKNVKKV